MGDGTTSQFFITQNDCKQRPVAAKTRGQRRMFNIGKTGIKNQEEKKLFCWRKKCLYSAPVELLRVRLVKIPSAGRFVDAVSARTGCHGGVERRAVSANRRAVTSLSGLCAGRTLPAGLSVFYTYTNPIPCTCSYNLYTPLIRAQFISGSALRTRLHKSKVSA